MSLLQTMINAEWLIEPEYLKKMYEIASRRSDADQAVETFAGYRLENTYGAEMRGNVAVIPVKGAIFRYANLFTEICGATSIELLARDVQTALDNPEVKGVLLDIDSPGGQVSGVNELAEIIYKARNIKPIKAYAGNLAASAAYFIAAACDEIVIDDMAMLGSIGVVSTISKRKDGDTMEIVSSRAPNKRPDYSTDEGLRQAQERTDKLEDVFIEKVAKYRSMEFNEVVEAGNKGGVRIGRDAVKYKLCDRLGSFEGVVEEMNKETKTQDGVLRGAARDGTPAQSTEQAQPDDARSLNNPVQDVQIKEPGTVGSRLSLSNAVQDEPRLSPDTRMEIRRASIEQERQRVEGIMSLSFPGAEGIVQDAIRAGKSKGDAAIMLLDFLKAQKKTESLHITPVGAEGEESADLRDAAMLIAEINKNKF